MTDAKTNSNAGIMDAKSVRYPCATCNKADKCMTLWNDKEDAPACKKYYKWFTAKWVEIKKTMRSAGFKAEPKSKRGRKPARRVECDNEKLKAALQSRHLTAKRVSIEHKRNGYWLSNMSTKGYVSQEALDALADYGITEEEIRA